MADSQGKGGIGFSTILIYVMLFTGLATVYMPMMQVQSPALGTKSWRVMDLVKALPKGGGEKKDPIIKVDYDFMDVLKKILPKNSKTDKPQKVSLTFILGILVPVALALTYALLILSLILAPVKKGPFFPWVSGMSFLTAAYSLAGIFYLGLSAEKAFTDAVDKASQGLLGIITKNLVPEISLTPATGCYVLAGVTLGAVVVSQWRRYFS